MLSFMHAQYSLFQQGYNLLDEIDPYMKKLAAEVSKASLSRPGVCSVSWAASFPQARHLILIWTIDKRQLRNVSSDFPLVDWYVDFLFDFGCIVPNKLYLPLHVQYKGFNIYI